MLRKHKGAMWINWLNLEGLLWEAARIIRIRHLPDEAWSHNSHRSGVTLLPSLKIPLIRIVKILSVFIGKPKYTIPSLSCWSFYVVKIWCYFHLKWKMEIWKWKGAGILSRCSLPLWCVICSRTISLGFLFFSLILSVSFRINFTFTIHSREPFFTQSWV